MLTWKYICPRSEQSLKGLKSWGSPRNGTMICEPSLPNRLHRILPIIPVAPKTVTVLPLTDDRPPVPDEVARASISFLERPVSLTLHFELEVEKFREFPLITIKHFDLFVRLKLLLRQAILKFFYKGNREYIIF